MNDVLRDVLSVQEPMVAINTIIFQLICATTFGLILSRLYLSYGDGFSSKVRFSRVLLYLAVSVTIIVSVVKVSMALSIGLVGALSIVRFRTAIKEPEELMYLLFAISIGITAGANQIEVLIIGFAFLAAIIVWHAKMSKFNINNKNCIVINVLTDGPQFDLISLLESSEGLENLKIGLKRMKLDEAQCQYVLVVNPTEFKQLITLDSIIKKIKPSASVEFVDMENIFL
jgi:hypothetical protein